MERYTEVLDYEASSLTPDDDLYEQKLLSVASMFRTFSEALTQFISEHGYDGSIDDTDAKVDFMRKRFKAAGISAPRDLKDWFSTKRNIERKTAFPVCFALGLNVEATNDFFSPGHF